MSQNSDQRHALHASAKTHGESIARGDAVISLEANTAGDTVWFGKHPDARERLRLATSSELMTFDRPSGTTVRIVKMDNGVLLRIFPERNAERN